MPQATDEQRKKWGTDGGVGCEKAIEHLKARGFKSTSQFNWLMGSEHESLSADDLGAAEFLVDEWDWGGFVSKLSPGEKIV